MLRARDPSTGTPLAIECDGEFVTRREPVAADAVPPDTWITPAFFDLQVNGALGVDFSNPGTTPDQVRRVIHWLEAHGVSEFLPTVVTGPPARTEAALSAIARAAESDNFFADRIAGIHLEGPFISPRDGYRGAHPAEYCRAPDWGLFARFQDACDGRIRLVTLAPELPGSTEFIARLTQFGVRVALGHTAADAHQISAAIDAGAILSTHLGNGLASALDRHRNPLWPQLADDRLAASVIADGHHLPDDILTCITRLKRGQLVSTCDASPLAGLPPGDYQLWDQPVTIDAAGVPRVPGTNYLAGSGHSPLDCVSGLIARAGLTLAEAITAASVTPRRLLGLPVPELVAGARRADFRLFRLSLGEPLELIAGQP